MKTLLKEVVPVGQKQAVNILIADGRIAYVGADAPAHDEVIEGKGAMVSPGWVDMRAFFADPGYEHRETIATGCKAAAAGGFTDVALLPNSNPIVQTKNEIRYLKTSAQDLLTQVHPIGAVTLETEGKEIAEMIDLHTAGAIAFSDGKALSHTGVFLKALQYLQKFDGLLMNRPEDEVLTSHGVMHEGEMSTVLGMPGIPAAAEEIMIARDLRILEYTGGRLHLSLVSSARSVEMIREAKAKGLQVSCDVAIHQLIYNDEALRSFDTNYKVNPPYRLQEDIDALIEGLKDGTIDAIVSDHSPYDPENKELEFDLAAFGVIGLQTFLPYLARLSESVAIETLIEKITTGPRKLLKLPAVQVEKGQDAHLTVFDLSRKWTFDKMTNHSLSHNSPDFGKELTGQVVATIRGEKVHINPSKWSF